MRTTLTPHQWSTNLGGSLMRVISARLLHRRHWWQSSLPPPLVLQTGHWCLSVISNPFCNIWWVTDDTSSLTGQFYKVVTVDSYRWPAISYVGSLMTRQHWLTNLRDRSLLSHMYHLLLVDLFQLKKKSFSWISPKHDSRKQIRKFHSILPTFPCTCCLNYNYIH